MLWSSRIWNNTQRSSNQHSMTYVLSDIHGDMDAFDSILSQIQLSEDDHLYIIGDVIDRGEHSIELLQRIRNMPNATLMLGNHEYMMIDRLRHPGNYKIQTLWYWNDGGKTENQFLVLNKTEQEELLQYLESLPVQLELQVNGQMFLLVHACPIEFYDEGDNTYKNATHFAVWFRFDSSFPMPEGKTVIFGHSPTFRYQPVNGKMRIYHGNRRIGIDCGCAYPWRHGQLGCLRLEDMKEFYSSGTCGILLDRYDWEDDD